MEDKPVKKLTWRRAYHLLKCEALRRLKLKLANYKENESVELKHVSLEKPKLFQEKIIYPSKKVQSAPRKSYVTQIYLNDMSSFKKYEPDVPSKYDEAISDLGISLIKGIVQEIKSRSDSSPGSRKTSFKLGMRFC